jgi:ribonuclease P protein component
MLAGASRLRASEVEEVLKKGRGARGIFLSVKKIPTTTPLRFAVVVSKKIAGSAVGRNRLRRGLYEALKEWSGTGNVVVFLNKIPSDPRMSFVEELTKLLS